MCEILLNLMKILLKKIKKKLPRIIQSFHDFSAIIPPIN